MKRHGSLGLMAFWTDIEADYIPHFQEWHNCEHIPERISIPGFNVGRRYRGKGAAPNFLMFYETDTASVFASDAYLTRLNDPTPWTQDSLPHFKNPCRNIYTLQAENGCPAPLEAPYIHTVRFNLGRGRDQPVDWLSSVEAYRTRLYAVDEAISNIMTSERQIYGGGPGQQEFLALIERATPLGDLPTPPGSLDVFSDEFWLEIALYPED